MFCWKADVPKYHFPLLTCCSSASPKFAYFLFWTVPIFSFIQCREREKYVNHCIKQSRFTSLIHQLWSSKRLEKWKTFHNSALKPDQTWTYSATKPTLNWLEAICNLHWSQSMGTTHFTNEMSICFSTGCCPDLTQGFIYGCDMVYYGYMIWVWYGILPFLPSQDPKRTQVSQISDFRRVFFFLIPQPPPQSFF